MRWFGLLLLLGGAIASFFLVRLVLWQDRAVRTFVPVEARVTDTGIRTHRGKNSTSYTPLVTYSYAAAGKIYTSTDVLPYNDSGSFAWADAIVKKYQSSPRTTAYINPSAPQESILIREYSATPYLFTGLALAAAGFGLLMFTRVIGGARKTMQAVLIDPAGWQLLLPEKSVKRNLRDGLLALLFTGLPIALLLAHLFSVKWNIQFFGWIPIVGALFMILLEIVWVVRAWSVSRHMSDPRVLVKPIPLQMGQPFAMKVELDAYSPLRIKSVDAKLACVEHYRERSGNKTQTGTRDKGVKPLPLPGQSDVPAGGVMEREGEWLVAAGELPPSDTAGGKSYPFYTWEVRLDVVLDGAADYKGVFPLEAI